MQEITCRPSRSVSPKFRPGTIMRRSSPIPPGIRAILTRSSMWRSTPSSPSLVALPAAYAFSRYRFHGRQASVFLAADQSYGAARGVRPALLSSFIPRSGSFDTHIAVALAHCLFNVPLASGFWKASCRGVPKEIDETAYIDGYSFWRFFVKIFMPTDRLGHRCGLRSSASCSPGSNCCWPHPDVS